LSQKLTADEVRSAINAAVVAAKNQAYTTVVAVSYPVAGPSYYSGYSYGPSYNRTRSRGRFTPRGTGSRRSWAGNRSGKTTAGIVDDLIQAVDVDACRSVCARSRSGTPPFYCRIVTPGLHLHDGGRDLPEAPRVGPKDQLRGGEWDKAYDKQLRKLRFANGSGSTS
jgi:hypothetical protein